eukprot:5693527-Prymnesium_polylepis.1
MTRAPTARKIAARRPCAHSDRTTALCTHIYPSAVKRIAVQTPWTNPWCATVSPCSFESALPAKRLALGARAPGDRSLEPARCAIRV